MDVLTCRSQRLVFLICLGILSFWSASLDAARAQTAVEITPEESVQMALEEHGLLQGAQAQQREAQALHRQARAGWWPIIRTQASYTRLSDNIPPIGGQLPGIDTTFIIAPVELNRFHTEVSVEQPLFTGFQRGAQIRAAGHRAEAAGENVQQERANVALEARSAYWRLAQAQSRAEALAVSLEHVEAHMRDVRNRFEAGAALQSHVLAAETRRAEVLLDQLEVERDLRTVQFELNQLIGRADAVPVRVQAGVQLEPIAESAEQLISAAMDDHPEIRAQGEQLGALRAEARAVRYEWLPDAILTGRYVYARPNQYFFAEQDEFRGTWEAGVALRWNLWEGGRRAARADESEARLQGAEARMRHQREQLELEITRRHLDADIARETVELARQAARQAEESFRVARQQFEAGAALSADVMEAEAALRAAQSREAEALAGYAIARATLLNVLGRVW